MEDLDTPRCVPGAADVILCTLEHFGLHWDEAVLYQSRAPRPIGKHYNSCRQATWPTPAAVRGAKLPTPPCTASTGQIYPGTCRHGLPPGRTARAWRVRTDQTPSPFSLSPAQIEFDDALQGHLTQDLEAEIGDFVVLRADGLFAYQLAVVVDDEFQEITHVVRGADLLTSTARQIWLQRLLGYPQPHYMHLPIAVNERGEKLSKQTLAAPVDAANPVPTLLRTLQFLRQEPPAELADNSVGEILDWAIARWNITALTGVMRLPAE